MEPVVLTLVLSSLAFTVSLVTLVWQLTRSRWERPIVVVGGGVGSHSSSTQPDPRIELRIDVTNIGERAVTLVEVGWITSADVGSMDYIGLMNTEVLEFPIRLEAHDSRSWRIDHGPIRSGGSRGLPYARVVQRPTWWEKRRDILPERTIVGRLRGQDTPDPKIVASSFSRGKQR